MTTAIIPAQPTALNPQQFDTSILAGVKSTSTIEQYKMHFNAYCRFAGSWQRAIQPETLAQWRQHLFEQGYTLQDGTVKPYSVNAINQRLASVRSVMQEAAQQGYLLAETAERFKHVKGLTQKANKDRRNPNARTKISRADMLAICNAPNTNTAAGKMHRALLLTLATAGIRISEAVTLRRSQIEWGQDEEGNFGWMVYVAGKNQVEEKPRALGKQAKEAIDVWLATRQELGIESEYIFTGFGGRGDRGPSDKPINRISAWQMVQRYAERVGLEHIKPHDFRRYVGTQLAKRDLRIAQNQLGHKRIETTAQNYVLDSVRLGVTDDLV
jgi:integrase